MIKIFYFMHIPWGWIKQRPHFIAENIDKKDSFKVDLFFFKFYRKSTLTKNNTKLNKKEIFKFPFERFKVIQKINIFIAKNLVKYIYKLQNYQYIWITDIRVYPYIKDIISSDQKLIYDCMDDILEFKVLQSQKKELEFLEKEVFKIAELIFFSSKALETRKVQKYQLSSSKYETIFNAFDDNLLESAIYNEYDHFFTDNKEKGYKIITYIGTISSWFDYGIIEKSLEEFDNIVYFIVGPVEPNIKVIKHQQVNYFGAIEHKYIKSLIVKSDILIMPFKLDNLIEAVDPVKIYEYVALGKEVISVKYKELEKFEKYINFYTNPEEYNFLLKKLLSQDIQERDQKKFIAQNRWHNRVEQIVQKLKSSI